MTATITLYCDHHDNSRRGCEAVYVGGNASPDEARFSARRHGWRYDWDEATRRWVDECSKHGRG